MGSEQVDNKYINAPTDKINLQANSLSAEEMEKPPKPKRWKKFSLIVVIGFVIILIISFIYTWFLSPTGNYLSGKRNKAKQAITDEFTVLENNNKLTHFATSIYDNCYKGQNNWKVKEGYNRKCDYQSTRYYGFNGDLRQAIVGLDEYLLSNNWQEESSLSLKNTIYVFDLLYGKEYRPYGLHNGGIGTATSLSGVSKGYSKNGIMLEDIEFAEKGDTRLGSLELADGFSERGFPYYVYEEKQDINTLFNQITQNHKYVIVISMEKNYFEQ